MFGSNGLVRRKLDVIASELVSAANALGGIEDAGSHNPTLERVLERIHTVQAEINKLRQLESVIHGQVQELLKET